MKPVLKRSQLAAFQRRRKFPRKSTATGKVSKMNVRALGLERLENFLTKGKSTVPEKNPE